MAATSPDGHVPKAGDLAGPSHRGFLPLARLSPGQPRATRSRRRQPTCGLNLGKRRPERTPGRRRPGPAPLWCLLTGGPLPLRAIARQDHLPCRSPEDIQLHLRRQTRGDSHGRDPKKSALGPYAPRTQPSHNRTAVTAQPQRCPEAEESPGPAGTVRVLPQCLPGARGRCHTCTSREGWDERHS